MPKDIMNERQQRMVELLEELLMWTRVTSIPQVRKVLSDLLQSDEQKRAYFHSDGKKALDEVARLAGCGESTISRWWKMWIGAGIAEPMAVQRGERARKVFSLDEFGIKVPQVEKDTEGDGETQQGEAGSQDAKDSGLSAER